MTAIKNTPPSKVKIMRSTRAIRRRVRSNIGAADEDARIGLVELSTRLDAIDSDYGELRSVVVGLGKRIDDAMSSINAKIDQRFQPQWQTWIAGIGLVGAVFFAFIAPIQQQQKDHASLIKDLAVEHRNFVQSIGAELNRRNELFVQQSEHREYRARIDNALNGIRTRIGRIEAAQDREQERTHK